MPGDSHPKPLPVVTEENRPFWEGCRQGKLLLQYCDQCRQHQFYPRLYCMHCGSSNVRWVSASGRGVIYSYTVIHQNKSPEFVQDTPYNVVVVQLAEGPRLMSTIVETGLAELRIDMPVTVVFDVVSEVIHLPRFKAL
jgi:uncharacterized OB-fold protein